MEEIFLVGYFPQKIKESFQRFFKRLGIGVCFANEDPKKNVVTFFKSNLIGFRSENRSLYGLAFPETKTVLIKYPFSAPIHIECLGVNGLIKPMKLFPLVALHEYLHVKGLDHCKSTGCLMAKTSCKANNGGGYCLSCLSLSKKAVPLCKECKEKSGTTKAAKPKKKKTLKIFPKTLKK